MRAVIFVSRSLDYSSLRDSKLSTSSQVFEYGIVSELNKLVDLRIVQLGSEQREFRLLSGLRFCSVNYRSLSGIFRLVKAIYENRNGGDFSIITTGYYPFEIATIVICGKIFGGRSFSYVYDTHLTATQKMPRLKRTLANIYFGLGFYWVRKLSGVLVLNDIFIKKRKIAVPFLKTKIGVQPQGRRLAPQSDRLRARKIIIFAGTINSENGADLLIAFLKKNPDPEFELHFYGDGDRAENVAALANTDARVKYFGRISDDLLQVRLRAADLLLNLRDPECIACDYAFPSKLVNFMATGTPVLSNRFPGLDDGYTNCLYIVSAFDAVAFAERIISLLNHGIDSAIGIRAREFVEEQHRWCAISAEVVAFVDRN
jgi:glycosyltransferase involved in cell wall biosynthesis